MAHIFPFGMMDKETDLNGARHSFWDALHMFWSQDQIDTWKNEIFPNGDSEEGFETPANFIAMLRPVHHLWNRGGFALKPISLSPNKKTLTSEFHWQKPMKGVNLPYNTTVID